VSYIKSDKEIELMREACKITGNALMVAKKNIRIGMSTLELDNIVRDYIHSCGAKCSFKNYNGYPGNICISINEEVVHGIPKRDKIIKDGDIVSVDVGAYINGYHGDACRTLAVGNVSKEDLRLIDVTKQSFFEGLKTIKDGSFVGDISNAVQTYVESNGFSIVRELEGHGVGRNLHEYPSVPNFGKAGGGAKLYKNMTIAIEPMVNKKSHKVWMLEDDWTIVTQDGARSAHYENSVLVTETGVEILTLGDEEKEEYGTGSGSKID